MIGRAVARSTGPFPNDPDERALLAEQDTRLLAVVTFAPWPGFVASAQLVGLTFGDDRARRLGVARDALGRFRKAA